MCEPEQELVETTAAHIGDKMSRILTVKEEQAIRLCHHSFVGAPTKEAAQIMGISQRRIQQILKNAKLKAPQMFPILTKRQAEVRTLINDSGLTFEQVAKVLDISANTVSGIVETLKGNGVCLEKRKPTKHYQDFMDNEVVEKF